MSGPFGYVADGANVAGAVDDAYRIVRRVKNLRVPASVRKAVQLGPALGAALGAIGGSAKSIEDMHNGERDKWMQTTFGGAPKSFGGTIGADTLRVMENVGNAIAYGIPGKIGGYLGSTAYDTLNPQSQGPAMSIQYGPTRRTNRRPREGGDVMNMVRDQAVMATDKAVFDNQTRPFRAPEKPDFSNVRGSSTSSGDVMGMRRRGKMQRSRMK